MKETKVKRQSGRIVTYLHLVSSVWDEQRKIPRHKVLCNLGRLDTLEKEHIQNLLEELSAYVDEPQLVPEDLLTVGKTLECGIPSLVEGVWKRLKVDRFFSEQLQQRKYEKPVPQAMLGMVVHRCQHPSSKRATEEWLAQEVYFPPAPE